MSKPRDASCCVYFLDVIKRTTAYGADMLEIFRLPFCVVFLFLFLFLLSLGFFFSQEFLLSGHTLLAVFWGEAYYMGGWSVCLEGANG